MEIKRYRHDFSYSYTLGMALTIELIAHKKALVRKVYVHPQYKAKNPAQDIFDICGKAQLPCEVNQRIFASLSGKENVYVIGVFNKADAPIEADKSHIVLVNPGDAGNLGTILRTGLGFGFRDYVIIRPGVDIFDPKAIRASMGALFHLRFSYYDSFEQYRQASPDHRVFSFMLDGRINLKDMRHKNTSSPVALVFGNEGAGLPDVFHTYGESVFIAHNNEIDSLNLSVAFGIAANAFAGEI
jgi:TrmH family RNA methyltransferase